MKEPVVVTEGLTDEQSAMVMANLGLIGFVLTKWGRQVADPHYSDDDAWQDGFFGLCRAVQLFDPTRGHKFSTMAVVWIRQAIQRGGGRFAGRQVRSAHESGTALPDLPLSLEGGMRNRHGAEVPLVDLLASGDDPAELAMVESLRADIAAMRDRLCRNHRDRVIFESLTNPPDGVSRTQTDSVAAAELGISREAVRKGRLRMAAYLAERLGLEVAV